MLHFNSSGQPWNASWGEDPQAFPNLPTEWAKNEASEFLTESMHVLDYPESIGRPSVHKPREDVRIFGVPEAMLCNIGRLLGGGRMCPNRPANSTPATTSMSDGTTE